MWLTYGRAPPVQDSLMLEVHQHRQPADRHQHPADARSSSPGLLAFIPLSVAHSAVSMAVVEDPVRPVVVPRWGRGPGVA